MHYTRTFENLEQVPVTIKYGSNRKSTNMDLPQMQNEKKKIWVGPNFGGSVGQQQTNLFLFLALVLLNIWFSVCFVNHYFFVVLFPFMALVCLSSIYGFLLPLWYLHIFLITFAVQWKVFFLFFFNIKLLYLLWTIQLTEKGHTCIIKYSWHTKYYNEGSLPRDR